MSKPIQNELVMVMGYPGSGRSQYLRDCYPKHKNLTAYDLRRTITNVSENMGNGKSSRKFAIIGMFTTRKSRQQILATCKEYGIPVQCKWLLTGYNESMFNYCYDTVAQHGKLINLEELKAEDHSDNRLYSCGVFNYHKNNFEQPIPQEGFASLESFTVSTPEYRGKSAIIFDYDGTLRKSKGTFDFPVTPNQIELLPNRIQKLKELKSAGIQIFGASNQSCIAKNQASRKEVINCFDETNRLLGQEMRYTYCPHDDIGSCFCRKPNVGMGAYLCAQYSLNPQTCTYVGNSETDKQFAENCGFKFVNQQEFFAE